MGARESRTQENTGGGGAVATRRVTHLFTIFPDLVSVSRPRRVVKEAAFPGPLPGEGGGLGYRGPAASLQGGVHRPAHWETH